MADDRVMSIAAGSTAVGINPDGTVMLVLGRPAEGLGFDPDLLIGTALSPVEARDLAARLLRKADEAEAGSSRH